MRVDITSMFFNSKIINKTATPAWRTSLGQSTNKNCRIETDTPGVIDILVGMTYKAQSNLSLLDTKGTSGDILICAVFDKVFINTTKIEGKYTMLVVRETSTSHYGRMQICYSPNYSYNDNRNTDTIENMRIALDCTPTGCWFVYDISVKNQDELHFSAIVVDANNLVEYSGESQDRSKLWKALVEKQLFSTSDIKEEFHRYLSDPSRFKSGSTGDLYWKTITSGRPEIAFLCEIIKDLFGYDCNDIFVITQYQEAEKLWKKVKEDPRNSFQNQLCSAIIGKYKDFLKERTSIVVTPTTAEDHLDESLQQIFYGAPGTGKSHGIEKETKGQKVIRTTFHPDSDYSTFVGAYKPVMREVETMTVIGTKSVAVEDSMGDTVKEKRIEYDFIPQAFTEAYVEAWKDLKKPVYLVIEEINRGNCAQIFGDIFQLLDRNENGFSSYMISPDEDLRRHLEDKFAQEGFDEDCLLEKSDILEIWEGKKMCLPPNLHIWATMNTSDQSLFPIDSAFKRRWDWKYTPISDAGKGYYIDVNGHKYDWWSFLEKVNGIVEEMTSSEDKQLGYFFCKAEDGKITAEKFVGKVIFYLWNDVFKDYGFDRDEFKYEDKEGKKKTMSFRKFFNPDGTINEEMAEKFLTNLKVEGISSTSDGDDDNGNNISSEIKKSQLKFWEGFDAFRSNNAEYSSLYNVRKPNNPTTMDLSFGKSNYWPYLKAVFTKNRIKAGIWIGNTDGKEAVYNAFKQNEFEINKIAATDVEFKKTANAYSLRVEKVVSLQDEGTWQEAYVWLMDMAVKMNEIKDKFGI